MVIIFLLLMQSKNALQKIPDKGSFILNESGELMRQSLRIARTGNSHVPRKTDRPGFVLPIHCLIYAL
jgi:hypothetical protein